VTRGPERIDQVIPSIVERDAVSYHTLEAQSVLRSLGFQSEIFTLSPGVALVDKVKPLSELTWYTSNRQWLCYQASVGSPAAEVVADHPGVKLLNYHNITPAELVEKWMPSLGAETRLGREQLARLAPLVSLGIGVSAYNTRELEDWGYQHTAVSMLMQDRSTFDAPPDLARAAELRDAKRAGGADWLFVGQMLPHKAHDDLVRSFAAYVGKYDSAARLHLVGRYACAEYVLAVRELVDELGLTAAVEFHGSIGAPELTALYHACDIFVGCSDHEGFCAPLLEAMHHGLPIVAYGAAAVPETVGDCGIVLDSKEPAVVAAAAHRVLSEEGLRDTLVERGRARVATFTLERARSEFAAAIESAVSMFGERRRQGAKGFSLSGGRVRGRPTRIDQVTPSIVDRDAVSFHYLEAQRVLRSLGFVSEIYAVTMGPEMAGRAHPVSELPQEPGDRQWVCYQASIGSRGADVVAAHPGVKLVDYHNITPAHLVEKWMPSLGDEVRLGRKQLAELAPLVSLGIGDSAYNVKELEEWGYRRSVVSMLMLDRTNFDVPPDPRRLADMADARSQGGADWLYVGQMLPHKAQHDLVMGFAAYLRAYDGAARLHVVGRDACPAYALGVRKFVDELGISGSVTFEGSIGAPELTALYESCDVFVGCSDHEGFCAPLLEAMHHGLPIVVYGAAAVPDTVGEAGVVLDSKEPSLVAAAVHRVLDDETLRSSLVEKGHQRAALFTPERAREEFARVIESAIEELAEV
jgi:glycosyltransferase involved in cell wall biosynthesis